MSDATDTSFATRLIEWQRRHGRKDMPWQADRDPYRIWLSEIMLQQTQVKTVVPYYERFLARFPSIVALAQADIDEVMRLWSGLGYYSRARNLHRAATLVATEFDGVFPEVRESIERLPGVGRSTAAAISAFAFGKREAILDGNVKRVLARHFAVEGVSSAAATEQKLWPLAESLLPKGGRGIEAYTQALMDLGATLCTLRSPECARCPVGATCVARAHNAIAQYPTPRQRKVVPQRETTMLVLLDGADILLERRPPVGIWGGLWCFPEAASKAEAISAALRSGAQTLLSEDMQHGQRFDTLTILNPFL